MTLYPQRFLGICGRAGSGKDTVARALAPRFVRIAFADCLRDAIHPITGWTPRQLEDRVFKETLDPLWNMTPRKFLQLFGTEVGRVIDPDVWVKAWERKVAFFATSDIVTTDVRFPNEIEAIRRHGGKVVRVQRTIDVRHVGGDDREPVLHESERHVMDFKVDLNLMNFGTLEELECMAVRLPKTLWGEL